MVALNGTRGSAGNINQASPMIISAALTGAVPSKKKFSTLPTSPEEIAEQAVACSSEGAAIVHLHMRDSNGSAVHDSDQLRETMELIRAEDPELILCATTTSRGGGSISDRLIPLGVPPEELPELASLTMGSYNTPHGVNVNPPDELERLSLEMERVGVSAELEIFEPGMLYTYLNLHQEGKMSTPGLVNILLGVRGASPASARELVHIVDLVPPEIEWAVAGIGKYQKAMTWLGALMGGNVRVGMEDDPRGEWEGWTNVDAVRRAVRAAEEFGRTVATPEETRKRLNLRKAKSQVD